MTLGSASSKTKLKFIITNEQFLTNGLVEVDSLDTMITRLAKYVFFFVMENLYQQIPNSNICWKQLTTNCP